MLRSVGSKVAWVGRTASMVFGLALVMALVLGVATTAMGANGNNFVLGILNNAATKVTGLVGNVDGAAALRVTNPNSGTNDTALDLRVQAGEAPMKVNSSTRVANLNAATAGRADTATSAQNAANAQNAATLDGKDSSEFLGKTEKAADADQLDGQDSPALLNGQLINTLQGNLSSAPNNSTGYINVISNYTPPVNATAASFVRCSYDGNTADQKLAIRAAMRSPSGSGAVTVGESFYILTSTPGANMSVLNQNSDTFEITANQSYDFGVNTSVVTPSNGTNPDICTATVLIFRR